ncbi:MAG: GNAT family N-acetyltransferase [Myxococcota bacterium]
MVRNAEKKDLEALAAIERAAARRFPAGRLHDPEATLSSDVLEASLESDLLFAHEEQGRVVGFACATREERFVHLHEMSVHPEFGQRGIGSLLLARVIEEARSDGAVGVTLTTFVDIPWNQPFYRRRGFASGTSSAPSFLKRKLESEADAGMTGRIAMVYAF